ncbi:UNVERIFIED_CONTAM: hypothetical protein K2H54_024166 [Gekko kuhli]
MWVRWHVAACLLNIGFLNAAISQPRSRVLWEGQTVQLECTQTDNHERMFWYRQDAGQALQFLYLFVYETEQERGNISARFTAKRPQTSRCNLNISSVE